MLTPKISDGLDGLQKAKKTQKMLTTVVTSAALVHIGETNKFRKRLKINKRTKDHFKSKCPSKSAPAQNPQDI